MNIKHMYYKNPISRYIFSLIINIIIFSSCSFNNNAKNCKYEQHPGKIYMRCLQCETPKNYEKIIFDQKDLCDGTEFDEKTECKCSTNLDDKCSEGTCKAKTVIELLGVKDNNIYHTTPGPGLGDTTTIIPTHAYYSNPYAACPAYPSNNNNYPNTSQVTSPNYGLTYNNDNNDNNDKNANNKADLIMSCGSLNNPSKQMDIGLKPSIGSDKRDAGFENLDEDNGNGGDDSSSDEDYDYDVSKLLAAPEYTPDDKSNDKKANKGADLENKEEINLSNLDNDKNANNTNPNLNGNTVYKSINRRGRESEWWQCRKCKRYRKIKDHFYRCAKCDIPRSAYSGLPSQTEEPDNFFFLSGVPNRTNKMLTKDDNFFSLLKRGNVFSLLPNKNRRSIENKTIPEIECFKRALQNFYMVDEKEKRGRRNMLDRLNRYNKATYKLEYGPEGYNKPFDLIVCDKKEKKILDIFEFKRNMDWVLEKDYEGLFWQIKLLLLIALKTSIRVHLILDGSSIEGFVKLWEDIKQNVPELHLLKENSHRYFNVYFYYTLSEEDGWRKYLEQLRNDGLHIKFIGGNQCNYEGPIKTSI